MPSVAGRSSMPVNLVPSWVGMAKRKKYLEESLSIAPRDWRRKADRDGCFSH